GPTSAGLLNTSNGQPVATNGLNAQHYMWMPQFAPNGKKVVFNHAKPDGMGGTDRRELATMDFDATTNTFSNLRVIVSRQGPEPSIDYQPTAPSGGLGGGVSAGNGGCGGILASPPERLSGDDALGVLRPGTCTGPCYPAWPFFTPDGNGVIYALINEPDF